MQQKEGKIFSEIDLIINCIHKDAPQELRQYFHSWSKKVLSSVSGRPNNDSIPDLRQAITKKVANTHDQRSVLQVQETTQRFLNNNMISRKPQVLRMLLKLSDEMGRSGQDFSQLFPYPKKKDLNLTTQTNFTSISQNLPQPRRPQQLGQQLKIIRNRGSIQEGISELDIVKQLSFVFTNTSSNQILQVGQGYQLKSSINVSQTVRKMVHEMSDLGWLHKKILKYSQKEGTVRKALRLGVQQQLNEFYRWIASMQNFIKENRLNLRKLFVWSYYPEQILRWLAIILDAVEPFQGSHIISIINSYRPSGITAVDGLINRILTYTLQPLLNYIHNWTYMGELLDSRGQFFIAENKKVYESQQWHERFKLINQNIPNILNGESAKMIFDTGKAIHFLRNKCKVLYNVKTPFFEAKNIENITVQGSNTLISATFMSWLQTVHNEVNKVLVDTLFGQFNLKYHLQSMKNFFLVGKGDFIQTLYDFLKEKFSQKKQQITEHSLDGYISDAISKCCPDFTLPDGTSFRSSVADRLLAKKIDFSSANGSNEGWDCFNFQYSLQRLQPLQTLFSPETMINYQKIFYFLWKIKQFEEILKNIWIIQSRQSSLRLRRIKSKQLYSIFHFTYTLRSSMSHFFTNLHSYLMTTIEMAWNRFWEEIGSAKSFNDIIRRHRQFQQQILQITLNTPKDKHIQGSLGNFFIAINKFKVNFFKLQDSFDDYYQKLRLYEDRQRMAQRGIIAESLQIPQFNLSKSYKELRQVKDYFDNAFKVLYIHLKKEGETKNSALNILLAKLDFNAYYSNSYENNQF